MQQSIKSSWFCYIIINQIMWILVQTPVCKTWLNNSHFLTKQTAPAKSEWEREEKAIKLQPFNKELQIFFFSHSCNWIEIFMLNIHFLWFMVAWSRHYEDKKNGIKSGAKYIFEKRMPHDMNVLLVDYLMMIIIMIYLNKRTFRQKVINHFSAHIFIWKQHGV